MSDTRIPTTTLTGPYGMMLTQFSKKMLGEVMEPLEVAWHSKPVAKFSVSVSQKMSKFHACDADLKSYAHMAVASLVGCSFCLDLSYFMANNEGLDVTKASAVPHWRESDVFSPLERDVLEYAESMTQTPPTVTDEVSDRLLAQLGAPALVELGTVIATANLMARTNVAWGVGSQGFARACGLQPLSQPTNA